MERNTKKTDAISRAKTPKVIVRSLGNRTFEEIPPSEIAEIMRRVKKKSPGKIYFLCPAVFVDTIARLSGRNDKALHGPHVLTCVT